jgi:hypothetical protein
MRARATFEQRDRRMSGPDAAFAACLVAAACVALLLADTGGATTDQQRKPTPEKLWQAYPLDTSTNTPSPAETKRVRPRPVAGQDRPRSSAPADVRTHEQTARTYIYVGTAFAAALVLVLMFATGGLAFAGSERVRRRRPSPVVRRLRGPAKAARRRQRRHRRSDSRSTPSEGFPSSGAVLKEPPAVTSASDALRAKRERDDARDRDRYAAAERETLRRKIEREAPAAKDPENRPDPESATLKAKLQRADAAVAQREAGILKLKSEQMPPDKAAALRTPHGLDESAGPAAGAAVLPGGPPTQENGAFDGRPFAPTTGRRQSPPARRPVEECTIGWWRDHVNSHFTAVSADGDVIGFSPFFPRRANTPREAPPATEALGALVKQLQREGWTPSGRREEWFELRFVRDPNRDRQSERQGRSPSVRGGKDAPRQW